MQRNSMHSTITKNHGAKNGRNNTTKCNPSPNAVDSCPGGCKGHSTYCKWFPSTIIPVILRAVAANACKFLSLPLVKIIYT